METIYLSTIVSLIIFGSFLIKNGLLEKKKLVRFQARPVKRTKEMIMAMKDNSADELFLSAGINLSIAKYTAVRNFIAVVLIGFLLINIYLDGIYVIRVPLILIMLIYFLTKPKEYYGKKKKPTPFKLLLDVMKKSYREKKDQELMNLVVQLKNMIITQSEHPKSADYIIETLMRYSHDTAPIFMSTLSMMRRGDTDEACKIFARKFDTKLGNDFSYIIGKLDALNPKELIMQIEAFESGIKEVRRTKRIKKQEANGHKFFAFASVLIAVVFFDYMYLLFGYLSTKLNF